MAADSLPPFAADAFLTSLREEKREEVEVAGMARVRELHGKLNVVVGTLSEKVSAVLRKQESEFLTAYRAHMYNVQKELQELRAKVDEAEMSLKKNDKIRKLEEERDWYKKEALRLDSFALSMKKDLRFMKERLDSIEDDRNWLERQLKAARKQNKLLRAELEQRRPGSAASSALPSPLPTRRTRSATPDVTRPRVMSPSPRSASVQPGQARPKAAHGRGRSSPAFGGDMDGASDGGYTDEALDIAFDSSMASMDGRAALARSSSGGGGHLRLDGASHSRGGSRGGRSGGSSGRKSRRAKTSGGSGGGGGGGGGGRGMDEEARAHYRSQIRQLKASLDSERRALRKMRAAHVSDASARGDLEVFFLRCVEDVKRSIERRRLKQKQRGARSKADLAALAASSRTLPSLREFTATDRAAVVEKLLQQDEVLNFLYDNLFPPLDGPPGSAASGGGAAGMEIADGSVTAPEMMSRRRSDGIPDDMASDDASSTGWGRRPASRGRRPHTGGGGAAGGADMFTLPPAGGTAGGGASLRLSPSVEDYLRGAGRPSSRSSFGSSH